MNHTLEEAGLSGAGDRHGISVLAIRRGRTTLLHPASDEVMESGDVLILAADSEQISRLPEIGLRLAESDAAHRGRRGSAVRS